MVDWLPEAAGLQRLAGVIQGLVVTALPFRVNSGMCSKFRPQNVHLLPSWWMDPLFPGVIQIMVVTSLQLTICSGRRRSFVNLKGSSYTVILSNSLVEPVDCRRFVAERLEKNFKGFCARSPSGPFFHVGDPGALSFVKNWPQLKVDQFQCPKGRHRESKGCDMNREGHVLLGPRLGLFWRNHGLKTPEIHVVTLEKSHWKLSAERHISRSGERNSEHRAA